MNAVRKLGAILIALAAVVVWFAMAPGSTSEPTLDAETSASAIESIMTNDVVDQGRAEGAPQQAVVNGWTSRDLLEVLAKQGAVSGAEDDNRPAALLLLAVIGVALILFTSGIEETRAVPAQTEQPGSLQPDYGPPAG